MYGAAPRGGRLYFSRNDTRSCVASPTWRAVHKRHRKDTMTVAQATTAAPFSSRSRRMPGSERERTRNPPSGRKRARKGRTSMLSSFVTLPLQEVEGVHVQGVAVAVGGDDDREAHRRF